MWCCEAKFPNNRLECSEPPASFESYSRKFWTDLFRSTLHWPSLEVRATQTVAGSSDHEAYKCRLYGYMTSKLVMNRFLFSTIDVSRQVFFHTTQSFAIVNLKPIVPGRKFLFDFCDGRSHLTYDQMFSSAQDASSNGWPIWHRTNSQISCIRCNVSGM